MTKILVVFGGRVPRDPDDVVERAMLRDTPKELADRRGWARRIATELEATS